MGQSGLCGPLKMARLIARTISFVDKTRRTHNSGTSSSYSIFSYIHLCVACKHFQPITQPSLFVVASLRLNTYDVVFRDALAVFERCGASVWGDSFVVTGVIDWTTIPIDGQIGLKKKKEREEEKRYIMRTVIQGSVKESKERKVNHLGVVAAFRRISHRYSPVKGMRGLEIGRLVHLWKYFWRRRWIVQSVGHPSACPVLQFVFTVGVSSLTLATVIARCILAQRDQTIEIEVPSFRVSCNVSMIMKGSRRKSLPRKEEEKGNSL